MSDDCLPVAGGARFCADAPLRLRDLGAAVLREAGEDAVEIADRPRLLPGESDPAAPSVPVGRVAHQKFQAATPVLGPSQYVAVAMKSRYQFGICEISGFSTANITPTPSIGNSCGPATLK